MGLDYLPNKIKFGTKIEVYAICITEEFSNNTFFKKFDRIWNIHEFDA